MFDELSKYKSTNHFFFNSEDDLSKVCNAPKNGVGVFLVYALKNGRIELVYIGASGKLLQNGNLNERIGGINDTIVNGKQFEVERRKSWKSIVEYNKIEALDVYWYETFDQENFDIPNTIKGLMLQKFFDIYGTLPKWNKDY